MKLSIRFLTIIILLGGVIGGISVGPGSILSACQKDTGPYEKKYDYNGHWAEMYIDKAIVEGIVKGYTDGSFKPDEFISRAGFASMLDKIIKEPSAAKDQLLLTSFNDYKEVPEWAQKGFSKAISLGLLKGYSDKTIRPMSPLARQDIMDLISKEKLPPEVFKQKNNNFITRAEACTIALSIKENGLKELVSKDPADVPVKPSPEKKASNSVSVPKPAPSLPKPAPSLPKPAPPSNVPVPTPDPSSGGDIENNDPAPPVDTNDEQSTPDGEEESGADITLGTNTGEVVTPETGNQPTSTGDNPNGGNIYP